jgi:hypothetical protein
VQSDAENTPSEPTPAEPPSDTNANYDIWSDPTVDPHPEWGRNSVPFALPPDERDRVLRFGGRVAYNSDERRLPET